jgi:hypothetical protein
MNPKPNKDCTYCKGTGVYYSPNGPEDFYKDVCDCVTFEGEKKNETDNAVSSN